MNYILKYINNYNENKKKYPVKYNECKGIDNIL